MFNQFGYWNTNNEVASKWFDKRNVETRTLELSQLNDSLVANTN